MLVGRFRLAGCGAATFQTLTLYSAAIEASIFVSQAIWLFRTRHIRQRAKEAETDWEKFPEAQAWQNNRWRLSSIWKKTSASAVNEMIECNADASEQVKKPVSEMMRHQTEVIEQCRQV